MKGKLEHFSGTQILSLVSLAKKTGAIKVNRDGEGGASLLFKEGKLVFAATRDADGTLASILARDGRITREQAASLAQHAAKIGDQHLGLLLIQRGYVQRAEIVQSIKRHALVVVKQFAGWRSGDWAFEQGTEPARDRITVPLDLENVIIEIARAQKRDEQLEREIPSLDVRLQFIKREDVKLQDLQLNKDEWRVLKYVKPENSIRMIANTLEMNDNQVRRVVGSLREAGLVELVAERQREKLSAQEKTEKRDMIGRIIRRLNQD